MANGGMIPGINMRTPGIALGEKAPDPNDPSSPQNLPEFVSGGIRIEDYLNMPGSGTSAQNLFPNDPTGRTLQNAAGVATPGASAYEGSIQDPTTGLLKGQFNLPGFQLQRAQSNIPGLEGQLQNYQQNILPEIQERALGKGLSPWAQAAHESERAQEQIERQKAIRQSEQQRQQAESRLAMRGGVGSGSRAALAQQSQRAALGATQDVALNAQARRAKIGETDAKIKQELTLNLPKYAMDPVNAWANIATQEYNGTIRENITFAENQMKTIDSNIRRALDEHDQRLAIALEHYKMKMKQYHADNVASQYAS